MTKTTTVIAIIGGLTLGGAVTARAQTPADPSMFASISAGGQLQSRDFSQTNTFNLYDEAGTVTANQTVGSGFVFDASVGYRVWHRISAAIGVSTFRGTGTAAAIASVPNALFRGKQSTKIFAPSDFGDLGQTDTAINFQAVWMKPLTDKIDLWVFLGPSIIRVKQDLASVTETAEATATIKSESKTTAKAGTIGVDLNYKLTDRYSVGGFIRYLGGEADLPSSPKFKVGGAQAAVGIRVKF